MSSCKMTADCNGVHSNLFGEVVVCADNVGKSAPRLYAKERSFVLMPNEEVIKAVKLHLNASVAYAAIQGYAVALYVTEYERIKRK